MRINMIIESSVELAGVYIGQMRFRNILAKLYHIVMNLSCPPNLYNSFTNQQDKISTCLHYNTWTCHYFTLQVFMESLGGNYNNF